MSTSSRVVERGGSRWRLALIVIVVWTASIPAAEGVFRLLGERTTTDLSGLYQAFGKGSYRLRDGVSGTADTLQGRYSVSTNALGLRCAGERKGDWPQTPVDILVLGDSQAFGAGLNFEDSIVGQLAAKAAARGVRIENAAIGGHYLTNQLELAQWLESKGVHPRRLLLFLSPYLIATAGDYNHVAVGSDGNLYARERPPAITGWLKRNTVTYGRLRNAIHRLHPLGKDELTPLAVRIYLKQRENEYRDRLLSALEEWRRWSDERKIILTVAYTPLAVEVAFDPVRESAGKAEAGPVGVDVPFSAARSATDALGLELLDLRSTLAQLAMERNVLTLPADPHYNARTSAACAERVWTTLATVGDLLPPTRVSARLELALNAHIFRGRRAVNEYVRGHLRSSLGRKGNQ